MPVGFYYKAFFKPRWLFPFHERQMRRVAGLGRINPQSSPATSPKDYAWCDVLVVGDGVIGRLAEDRFYVTATSSGAGVMYREMQRWALIWSMNVTMVNATGHYAAMNLAGPRSHDVLQGLVDADLGPEAFPYQGVREGKMGNIPLIMMRVGFVGEWGYEIHVPAGYASNVWEAIYKSAQLFDVRPFGVEAQRLLRLEKGHFIVTQDTDALTNPYEAGLGWVIAKDKPFFIGQRSLRVLAGQALQRQLVGVRWPDDHRGPLPDECNLVVRDGRIVGRITSIAHRSTLGFPLGMAFVEPNLAAAGTSLTIRLSDASVCQAWVEKLPFYDPAGLRQKASLNPTL